MPMLYLCLTMLWIILHYKFNIRYIHLRTSGMGHVIVHKTDCAIWKSNINIFFSTKIYRLKKQWTKSCPHIWRELLSYRQGSLLGHDPILWSSKLHSENDRERKKEWSATHLVTFIKIGILTEGKNNDAINNLQSFLPSISIYFSIIVTQY